MVIFLLKHRTDFKHGDINIVLVEAFKTGQFDVVLFIIAGENGIVDVSTINQLCKEEFWTNRLGVNTGKLVVREFLNQFNLRFGVICIGKGLSEACKNGHLSIVKLLLESRDDIPPYYAGRGLSEASKNGHLAIVELLLEKRIYIEPHFVRQGLFEAYMKGHIDIVNLLIERIEGLID